MNLPTNHAAFAGGAAYIDGQFVPMAEARIPIGDWGFLHSDATYDVAHVWQGSFFRLEDHLDRFFRGMERLHMSLPLDRHQIRDILFRCVRLTGLRDAYVEMICTRGLPAPAAATPPMQQSFHAFAIPSSGSPTQRSSKRACTWSSARRSASPQRPLTPWSRTIIGWTW